MPLDETKTLIAIISILKFLYQTRLASNLCESMNYSDTTQNTKYEHKTKIHRTDTYTKKYTDTHSQKYTKQTQTHTQNTHTNTHIKFNFFMGNGDFLNLKRHMCS